MPPKASSPAGSTVPPSPAPYARGYSIESVKFSNVNKLTGSSDYPAWRDAAEFVLSTYGAWEVMTGTEAKPEEDEDEQEKLNMWTNKNQLCRSYLIQTVDNKWFSILTTHKTPERIWKALQDKFARENTTAFYIQFKGLYDLKLDDTASMKDHLLEFDTHWNRIQQRCSSATSTDKNKLPSLFKPILDSEEAKAAFLLLSLPASLDNVVDNLQTKENLTYNDAYQRLTDIADRHEQGDSPDPKANKVSERKSKGKGKDKATTNTKEKECTYCKRHYPNSRYTGHIWNECFKLQKAREAEGEKPVEQGKVASEEQAGFKQAVSLRSSSTPLSTPKWVFDTAASSHMTNNPDILLDLRSCQGQVRIGDDSALPVKGYGSSRLTGLIPGKQPSPIVLSKVLLVPRLGHCNLLSWKAIQSTGSFFIDGTEDNIYVRKGSRNGEIVLWSKLIGNDYVVQQQHEEKARLTIEDAYTFWHQAFGHPNKLDTDAYDDLPPVKRPKKFHCEPCLQSKSTKTTPKTTYVRAKEELELVHSDLSGKFSVPSYGGSNYYISFVDDKTRKGWISFLREKSDASAAVQNFITQVQRQTGRKLKRLRTDNGGEYIAQPLKTFLQSEGIVHEFSPAYFHESNGVAERYNRTIVTAARTMLIGLDK
jgi:hypothetical protein